MWEGAEVPLYPVETVRRVLRRVELEPSSVTKIPVTVKGDPKGCWILEPGFLDCRFFMPSAVMGPSNEGYVWVINDAKDKMFLKLLDSGIISRGVSEWASPTVLVRKRDGHCQILY